MYKADYHTHSIFSDDCSEKTEDMVISAISKGLDAITLTDHIDFMYPDKNYPFIFDYNEYRSTLLNLRDKYRDKIDLRIGVEMGLQPIAEASIKDFLSRYEFDFVIGSTHCVENLELYEDRYYKGKSKNEAYTGYFLDVLNSVKAFSDFNVYGHIDYVNRYGSYEDNSLDYYKYKDIIDLILKELIETGRGIELNTSGLRYRVGYIHPKFEILKEYKNLGGEIITIGSDAHKAVDVGYGFNEAYSLLKEVGFRYISIFKDRRPEFIKI